MTAETGLHSRILSRLIQSLIMSPRYYKRAILVAADAFVLIIALWLALYLRHSTIYVPGTALEFLLLLAGPALAVMTFGWFGVYRIITRYFSSSSTNLLIAYFWLSLLVWSVLVFMLGQLGVPRTAIIGYGLIGTFAIVAVRHVAALILNLSSVRLPAEAPTRTRKKVLIYGASEFGLRIFNALKDGSDFEPIGFVDSSSSVSGQRIGGVTVYHPDKLSRATERLGVKVVLLAIPEAHRRERRQVVEQLQKYPVEVKTLPLIEDIAAGRVNVTNVHSIKAEELLGRDPVPPMPDLLSKSIRDKSILVTGAGGSIGSEIVRQVCHHQPSRLVLLDSAEPALYAIDMEVHDLLEMTKNNAAQPEIVTVLGSVLDTSLLRDVLRLNDIQTIYHAAAYKHVPIVEDNPIVALQNNAFGTAAVAEAAKAADVERVVLVSTDKAVRPTNIMGASKRIAELVCQAHSVEQSKTIFSMVRFGNVLDSSGSVAHRFRKQIAAGGPVTVTHAEITRYFMSVREAAELVIQAGSMAKGGEVFVLDMGEPIKINQLAQLMIRLAGFDVRTSENPNGDIEIKYTGLRPGEKLFEELLIGSDTGNTDHPRIMLSHEPLLRLPELTRELDALSDAMDDRDLPRMLTVIRKLVEGYSPSPPSSVSIH